MASQLVPFLHCPVCPPSSPLVAPVTLFCGHSVCASHVLDSPQSPSSPRLIRLSPCPLSSCTVSPSNSAPLPNIPSSSRVTFYPAAGFLLDRDAVTFATIPDSRTDVTINKLASIVHRYDQYAQSIEALPTLDSGSGSDSEADDEEILDTNTTHPSPSQPGVSTPGPTSIVPSDASSSSSISTQIASSLDASLQQQAPARPNARKRRRKHLPPPRRLDSPAQSADQFEKDLLDELSCQICIMLLYQPITSPCQHVRALLSHPSRISPPPSAQSPPHLPDLLFEVSIPRLRPWPSLSNLSPALAWGHVFPRSSIQQDNHLDQYVPTPIHACQLTLLTPPSSPASPRSLSRSLRRTRALDRARRASCAP